MYYHQVLNTSQNYRLMMTLYFKFSKHQLNASPYAPERYAHESTHKRRLEDNSRRTVSAASNIPDSNPKYEIGNFLGLTEPSLGSRTKDFACHKVLPQLSQSHHRSQNSRLTYLRQTLFEHQDHLGVFLAPALARQALFVFRRISAPCDYPISLPNR